MSVRIVMQVVAAGAVVTVDGDRLVCRVPKGTTLAPHLADSIREHKNEMVAALTVASLDETIIKIAALSETDRNEWEQALAHDIAAYSILRFRAEERR